MIFSEKRINPSYPAYPAHPVLFFFSHLRAFLKHVIFPAGIADNILTLKINFETPIVNINRDNFVY